MTLNQTIGLLPIGVQAGQWQPHPDSRGLFAEVYRDDWNLGSPVQWNYTESVGGSLRGMKVHPLHDDLLVLLTGSMHVGLRDLTQESETSGLAVMVEMALGAVTMLTVPHGVAHGLYFPEPCQFLNGVDRYWDPGDDLGCRYDDPDLELDWPAPGPDVVSDRDLWAGSLSDLISRLGPWQPIRT
jgi:dTDP-4-dehydrorhamnose 3,5-epimerase